MRTHPKNIEPAPAAVKDWRQELSLALNKWRQERLNDPEFVSAMQALYDVDPKAVANAARLFGQIAEKERAGR